MRHSNQEKDWDDLTAAATEKLVAVSYRWSLLSESVREIAALRKLELDMYNGGFLQFFCNWGFDGFEAALSGLKKIGAAEMHNLLNQTYSIIKPYQDDPRINNLWDLAKVITNADCAKMETLDNRFWKSKEQINQLALKFYGSD